MSKSGDTIIYLHLHRPIEGRMDYYFASLSDMYDAMNPNDIGVTRQSLRNYRFNERCFYANKYCTIERITIE